MKKNILITGSTDGIGKLAAIKLAKDGHQIYLHGRNSEKLSAVISEIKEISNNENIHGFVADFSELNSIKEIGEQIKKEVSKIDILINNAGVFKSDVTSNSIGLDIRFVVNYLAPYVLTNTIISLLNKGTETRIINLSSAAQSTISIEALLGSEQLSPQEVYAQSKLALTMWSFDFAKENSNLSVIAVNPGSLLNTNMVKEGYGYHWSPADKGATILYELATSKKYHGVSGRYFDNDKGGFGTAHKDAYDSSKIAQLLQETNLIINRVN